MKQRKGIVFGLVVAIGILGLPGRATASFVISAGTFGCRAMGVRVGTHPEIVANPAITPCADDAGRVAHIGVTVAGSPYPVDVDDGYVWTTPRWEPDGYDPVSASARVGDAIIGMYPLSPLGIEAVYASALLPICQPLRPEMARSSVGQVRLGITTLYPGADPMNVPIDGVGVLHLNWKRFSAAEVVQRAVYLETGNPETEVIIAEVRLRPCTT